MKNLKRDVLLSRYDSKRDGLGMYCAVTFRNNIDSEFDISDSCNRLHLTFDPITNRLYFIPVENGKDGYKLANHKVQFGAKDIKNFMDSGLLKSGEYDLEYSNERGCYYINGNDFSEWKKTHSNYGTQHSHIDNDQEVPVAMSNKEMYDVENEEPAKPTADSFMDIVTAITNSNVKCSKFNTQEKLVLSTLLGRMKTINDVDILHAFVDTLESLLL